MNVYTEQHPYYCGIDLHARSMYICILDDAGQVVYHKNRRCSPEALLEAIAPYREGLVIGVEGVFCWYWIADLKRINYYDPLIKDLDAHILRLAKAHDPTSLHLLKSIKGVGDVLALTMLYEIHDITRFPSRGEFCSYARLVKGQKSSAGKSYGTSGARIGNAHLRWSTGRRRPCYIYEATPKPKNTTTG